MTQRSTPRLQQQRREASARYRLAKRIKRPTNDVAKPAQGEEWDESERMPYPQGYFTDLTPRYGSSLSTPDVPYKLTLRGRAGCE